MKIAYVITRSDEVGGAHIHVRDMALWMMSKGHDVKVFVGGSGVYCERLKSAGVNYTSLDFLSRPISILRDYRAYKELCSHLNAFSPDLVSAHSAKAGLIARLVCKRHSIKCIFTAHGWAFADGVRRPMRDIYLFLERKLANYCNKIITVCENDRALAIRYGVGNQNKVIAVHNGMPEIPLDLVASPDKESPRLIMIARFEAQKDHLSLIQALSSLRHLPWTLDLIGEGDLQSNIQNMIAQLGLSSRVNFLGRRWDIAQVLSGADIFVLSSFWEGFPRSIIEAMRGGLPVVATDVAGVSEAVIDSVTGLLVKSGDANDLKNKLELLILNPELRHRMGVDSRERYLKYFTFEIMATKTLSVYLEALK